MDVILVKKANFNFEVKSLNMIYQELTHKIIGCAMKVHSTLGRGYPEVIYQRALAIEMRKIGLLFSQEMNINVLYEGVKIGTRRCDFFVEQKIMVELKARIDLDNANLKQTWNYLEIYNLPVGLLLNFGAKVYNTNVSTTPDIRRQ